MFTKRLSPLALSALLLGSPLAIAQETPDTAAAGVTPAEVPAGSGETQEGDTATPAAPGGMNMGESATTTQGPGMTTGGPGMMMGGGGMMDMTRCGKGMMMGQGMMGKGKMGQGMMGGSGGDDEGAGMMGGGGMMHGGKGGMMGGGKGGMQERYRELRSRLDLLDARMAKIETMLELLLQR
jgi:hypothetical protein